MRSLFSILVAACLMTACGQREEMSVAALQEGDWGWSKGADCKDLKDVWRVNGNQLIKFKDGKEISRHALISRDLEYSDRSAGHKGRLEGMIWTYELTDAAGNTTEHRDWFSVSYTSLSGFKSLIFAHAKERTSSGEFKKITSDRKMGNRLAPCTT